MTKIDRSGRPKTTRAPTPRLLGRTGRAPERSPNPLRALTSDLWYTLLYLRPADQRELDRVRNEVWLAALERSGISRPLARGELARMDRWATARESLGRTPSIAGQVDWLNHAMRARLASEEVADAMDGIIAKAPVRIAPGARRSLKELSDRGIPLGIVSNLLHETGRGARALLGSLGLAEYFSAFGFSDEHPWSKPRPEPFRFVLSRLGVPPDSAAHVGDLTYDVVGARRAGMRAFLYTGLHTFEPRRLRSLAKVSGHAFERVDRWPDVARRVVLPRGTGWPIGGRPAGGLRSTEAGRDQAERC